MKKLELTCNKVKYQDPILDQLGTVTSKIESMFGGFGLLPEYLRNETKHKQSVS